MIKSIPHIHLRFIRNYTSRAKRSLLRQDVNSLPVSRFPTSSQKKLRVYAWGLSENGALGMHTNLKKHAKECAAVIHHPTRLKFAENCDVYDVTAGYCFTAFAVSRSDGETLFGTGLNTDCQLGLQEISSGGRTKRLGLIIYPTAVSLPRKGESENLKIKCMSAGRAHLVVVTEEDVVFTLGNNCFGQCGRPIIEDEKYESSGIIHRIENVCGASDKILTVVCGHDHTLFVSKSGKVFTCGWGADGQTGRGNYESTGEIGPVGGDISTEKIVKVASTADTVLALSDKGEVFGWGNTEYGQLVDREEAIQINTPRALGMTKGVGKVIDIAAGGSFCMLLNEYGDVFTWGYGILGFGPKVEDASKPQKLLPPLFGRNDFNPESRVVSIYSGIFHMGAINTEGDLFMWGKNRFGCLGLGHQKDQYFPFKTAVNAKVVKVSCGVDHTIALCRPFI